MSIGGGGQEQREDPLSCSDSQAHSEDDASTPAAEDGPASQRCGALPFWATQRQLHIAGVLIRSQLTFA